MQSGLATSGSAELGSVVVGEGGWFGMKVGPVMEWTGG
jgi:hypothetical protein